MTFRSTTSYIQSPSAPPSPILGDEWYNTTNNTLYKFAVYNGVTQWYSLGALIGALTGQLANINLGNTALTNAVLSSYSELVNSLGNVSGAATVNLGTANYFTATSVGATSWSFTNPALSPNASSFILKLINGGSYTQIWPSNTKWPGGVAPTLTVTGTDTLAFVTDDAATTWRGIAVMLNSQ
jgi:hypothetical protein